MGCRMVITLALIAYFLAGIWFWYACSAAERAPLWFIPAWPVILVLMLWEIYFHT